MKYEAIIFDFDGVICDSVSLSNAALAEGLTDVGVPTTIDEAIRAFAGKRWSDVLPMLEARIGRELDPSFIGQQYKRLSRRVIAEVGPVAGVEAFLQLSSAMPRAIASSSELIWIAQTLARFGLAHHFDGHVDSAAALTHGKPHPEVYLHAAAKLGIDPGSIVAIEGTATGVEAAVAAGMTVIGLTAASHIRGGDAERMRSAGASTIAMDYDDVADWIGL